MLTKQEFEIEAQKELINNLKIQLAEMKDTFPDQWDKQRGYITTLDCAGLCNESVTTGYDYVVLTEDEIAHRISGDQRDDGSWEVVNQEEFLHNVLVDAEEIMAGMAESVEDIRDASWDMAEHCKQYVEESLNAV